MDKVELPLIGQIDISSLRSFYRTIIPVNGMEVHFDLNFGGKDLNGQSILRLTTFLENLSRFHLQNLSFIKHNFYQNDSVVREYIKFQINENLDSIYEILELDENSTETEELFLTKFSLVRIGIYIEDNEILKNFAVFDYSISEITNYLIVLKTDDQGVVNEICWEG